MKRHRVPFSELDPSALPKGPITYSILNQAGEVLGHGATGNASERMAAFKRGRSDHSTGHRLAMSGIDRATLVLEFVYQATALLAFIAEARLNEQYRATHGGELPPFSRELDGTWLTRVKRRGG